MKFGIHWKILIFAAVAALLINCAPRRTPTQFSINKEAETGQTYTEDQLRAALGTDRYDSLVQGIGADNLNLLTYGIGISNMTQMINGITGVGKLASLMSDGPNSKKLSAIEVLNLLNRLDDACQQPGSFGTDTLAKMVNMINNVSLAGMEGVKNIVHGLQDQPSDLNGPAYQNSVARLGFLISLLNENLSVMPTLVNELAAPSGVFSASGNAKLIRLVNLSLDMRDLSIIVNNTTVLTNITAVMAGLTGNIYCSKPQYTTQATCTGNGGSWTNTVCSNPTHTTRTACTGAGATWTSDGIDNMSRLINELDRVCSNNSYANGKACIDAGATWRTKASKIPVIVNNISNVPNMYTIVNGLTNDGKRPAWPTVALPVGLGLPTAYPGDAGNVFDGVDSMVATINKLYVTSMGDADSFGTNGTLRMAYMVNNLDVTPVYSNDTNFDDTTGGYSCTTGNFDNRLNWAFSNNGSASAPFNGMSWATDGTSTQAGACSLRNDPTAATIFTQTESAELVANITTAGNMTFYYRTQLNAGDVLRFYVDDVQITSYTGTNGWTQRIQAVTTGVHRFRWDVHRRLNSTGQVYIDTVTLPGDKGASRTAAEKTFIMLNNLYIASSITNVADILNNVTAPACVTTPLSCTPTWNNGLDTLIHTVNRVEYPASISTVPRLATTVNTISNLQIMYDVLNNMNSQASTNQLIALMDFVETPANVPTLINNLTGSAGVRTADILNSLNAAGTDNMLRVTADTPTGAPILDTARLLNGVTNTIRVAEILNKLRLTANVYNTTSSTITVTAANPAVVTWSSGSHGLAQNARVSISTTGNLPTGLFSGRVYYSCPLGASNTAMNATQFTLATDQNCSSKVSTLGGTQSGTHTAMAGDETFFQSPNAGGGAKLAQFFNTVNSKGPGSGNVCNVNDNEDDFCIKNHLVRLVNDIATSASGSTTVAEIVGNLRPNAGPGGNDGVTRMVDVLFEMKNQTAGNKYTDPLSNSTAEDFGRLTAFIKDMTGGNAGLNTARMVNEVNLGYMSSRVTFLLKNINRMRYLSRMLSEMTSVDLMLQLLNDGSTNINTIDTLVDTHGNNTYGTGAIGSADPSPKYGANPSGTGCTTQDCDLSSTDQLGRLIQMINNIYAIGNTLTLINTVQDIGYVSYLIINVNRIKYLTDIVNNLTNVDLMVKVINGADACSIYNATNSTVATDTQSNCTAISGAVWFGVGRCVTSGQATQQTRASCLGAGGTWYGADQTRLKNMLNGLGGSAVKGSGSKNIGDMSTLWDVMNRLGYNGATARSAGQQVRVVRLVNSVEYCGLKPQYDKYIQYGPTCHNAGTPRPLNFQFAESCAAAGYTWQAKRSTSGSWETPSAIYNSCRSIAADGSYNTSYVEPTATLSSGGYYNTGDVFDARPRLLQAMLNVNDGLAFSYIVGDVQDTQKTIDMMNGVRRVGGITKLVNWLPGEITAALVNDTHSAAINRSLVYMANNLDDDETETAKAFASMIHHGTRVVAQGPDAGAPSCLEFTGLGPRRLAAVLNLEAGPYIEGLLAALGWQMSIAAMNCGWARDDGEHTGACPAVAGDPGSDGASGGMYKAVGGSYNGNPKPTLPQCIRARELTAGYKYGNYTWTSATLGTPQGTRVQNCKSILPNMSGGSFIATMEEVTDVIIWDGMDAVIASVLNFGRVADGIGSNEQNNNNTNNLNDMWSILKGTSSGVVGWVMTLNSSWVGFPPAKGYNNTAALGDASSSCSDNSGDNGDNWQCVREGLVAGDLGATTNGYYWGTYCSGAGTSGTSTTKARSCITNGGTWKTQKNFQSSTCKLDPSFDAKVGP
jgi:hypothetical protein